MTGRADGRRGATTDEGPCVAAEVDLSLAAQALLWTGEVGDTLSKVLAIAPVAVGGCDHAGILLIDNGLVTRPVRASPVVAELEQLQQARGGGPCLDALGSGASVYVEDLAGDHRWPGFGKEAIARGVHSLLALPLLARSTLGALNLYSWRPRAFEVVDHAKAQLLAAFTALAVFSALSHVSEDLRAANFRCALSSRELIGQAQGILMERERIGGEEAFDILSRASQHTNMKLREVAQLLVDTREAPETGPRRAPG